jgi:hypothetical protein
VTALAINEGKITGYLGLYRVLEAEMCIASFNRNNLKNIGRY